MRSFENFELLLKFNEGGAVGRAFSYFGFWVRRVRKVILLMGMD